MSSPTCATGPVSTPWSPGSGATSCSSPDRAAADRVGRDGRLALVFERRGARTVLTARRFSLPLQALEPVDLDGRGAATVYLLNPTGGVLGGDRLTTEVTLGPGSHVCLTTPSATRVYRAADAPSVVETRVRVGAGAVLEYLPDHLIPSPGADLAQSLDVELGPGALAVLLDAWAPGRVARGEAWRFRRLDLRISVRDATGLILHERARLVGPVADGPGLTEGRPYVAMFATVGDNGADWARLARDLHDALASRAGLLAGAAPLGRGGVTARILAGSAPDLSWAVAQAWRVAREALLGLPPLDLRKL